MIFAWSRRSPEHYAAETEIGLFEITKKKATKNEPSAWEVFGPEGYYDKVRLLEDAKLVAERDGKKRVRFTQLRRMRVELLEKHWEQLKPLLRLAPHPSERRTRNGETLLDWADWMLANHPDKRWKVYDTAANYISQMDATSVGIPWPTFAKGQDWEIVVGFHADNIARTADKC